MSDGIDIPIRAKVDGKDIGLLEGSIAALRKELTQAKKDFDNAKLDSQPWRDAAARVIDLGTRINDAVRPLREMAAAQQQLTSAVTASVNPWTTASQGFDTAARNLTVLTERSRAAKAALEAQAKAAEHAARAQRLDASNARQDAVAEAQRQMLLDMRESEQRTLRLKEAFDKLPPAQDKAAKGSSNAGRAVLELSRAFEDAQYGIAGVLNNLPGLVTMLGGSAGLAGVLSIAAVGATILAKRLAGANFDGTWIGTAKDAVSELVNGMTKAEQEARAIAEAPATWAKTVEQELEARAKKAQEVLEREIKLLNTKLEVQKQINTENAKEAAHAEKLFKLQNPNHFTKGTPEWAERETQTKEKEWVTREEQRLSLVRNAEGDKKTADEEAAKLTRRATEERKKADDLRKREDNDRARKQMEADAMAAEDEAARLTRDDIATGYAANDKRIRELTDIAKKNRASAAQREKANDGLYMGVNGETAGSTMASATVMEVTAREARDKAEAEARKLEAAKAESKRQMEINDAQLKRDKDDIASAQFEKASKDQEEARKKKEEQRQGKDRETETMPQNLTPPAPVPAADIESQVKGATNQLTDLYGSTKDPQARTKISALIGSVNDGKGNQQEELAIIQDFLAKLTNDRGQNSALLTQALKLMEDQQAEGSRMQAAIIGALSGMVGTLRDISARVQQQQNEINGLHQAVRP